MPTKIVKTYQLKVGGVVYAVGSVKRLADHAAYEMGRKYKQLADAELDELVVALRKTRRAEILGVALLTIEPIEEEYEENREGAEEKL